MVVLVRYLPGSIDSSIIDFLDLIFYFWSINRFRRSSEVFLERVQLAFEVVLRSLKQGMCRLWNGSLLSRSPFDFVCNCCGSVVSACYRLECCKLCGGDMRWLWSFQFEFEASRLVCNRERTHRHIKMSF